MSFFKLSERHCTLLGNLSEEKVDIPEPIRQYTGVPLVVIGYFICGGFHSGKNSDIKSVCSFVTNSLRIKMNNHVVPYNFSYVENT